jgi:undecaprenyl pyrophosphate phosphatase UppP
MHAQVLDDILNIFIGPGGLFDVFVQVGTAIALVVFVWGVVRMVIGMNRGEADKEIAEGKKRMMWGLIALFVLVGVWGIITVLVATFGTGGFTTADPPIILP